MTTKISGDNISAIANTGVTWQAVTVADGSTTLNASSGNGYFLDTNAGVIEVFLPTSPTRGDTIILSDYSGTFATNKVIVNTGGENIDSTAGNFFEITANNSVVSLVYVDAAKGWLVQRNTSVTALSSALVSGNLDLVPEYISATGGTVSTDTDYKIHTFTGDGCFVVSSVGNAAGSDSVDYLVIAGGGASGYDTKHGSGAGGYRESSGAASGCYTVNPRNTCVSALPVTTTTYPITVGGGGSAPGPGGPSGAPGSNSVFSTITSNGGGGGACASGGSGTGGGTGNTPPTNPVQGFDGGTACGTRQGGGGGAGTAGGDGSGGGTGGAGSTSGITASDVVRASGGGGGDDQPAPTPAATPGGGGKGGRRCGPCGTSATANTGGGSGGAGANSPGFNGGKGLVVIRYKYQN